MAKIFVAELIEGEPVTAFFLAKQIQVRPRKRGDPFATLTLADRTGDGYRGWPEAAPFDAIVVTAAATHVPAPLVEQLAEGGRLVLPVGPEPGFQELLQGRKQGGRLHTRIVAPVRFVPLVEPKH